MSRAGFASFRCGTPATPFNNNKRCRDTPEHQCRSFEIRGDHIPQQVLIRLLLVVETVFFDQTPQVGLEHPGDLNRKLLDAVLGIVLIAVGFFAYGSTTAQGAALIAGVSPQLRVA